MNELTDDEKNVWNNVFSNIYCALNNPIFPVEDPAKRAVALAWQAIEDLRALNNSKPFKHT